jgi:membrane dipeptidase
MAGMSSPTSNRMPQLELVQSQIKDQSSRIGRPLRVACCLFLLLCPGNAFAQAAGVSTPPPRDAKLWEQALQLHKSAIVIDGHNDITSAMVDERYELETPSLGKYHTDLARLKEGGVGAQFFAVYVDHRYVPNGMATRRALEMIDVVHRAVERNAGDLVLAGSVAEIRRARENGKIAALMGVENGAAIENSLATLRSLYRLGARYMTLTHMFPNDWADSSMAPPRHRGLTGFGREVIREMNRLGMMVDVSHVSDQTMSDAIEASVAPVIASHSSARALADHPRNISDDLRRRIAARGGVVMVNFYPGYIDPRVQLIYEQLQPQVDALRARLSDDSAGFREERRKLFKGKIPVTPIATVLAHIEHIIQVAGINHVGLGSDFDGISTVPEELSDVSMYPNVTYQLLKRGHSEEDVKKVLGENLLRVFSEAEKNATAGGDKVSGAGNRSRIEGAKRR